MSKRRHEASSSAQRKASKANTPEGDESDVEMESEDVNDDFEDSVNHETGQIMRVEVENFMCHKRFHVDFGRHMNYVTGENGSGKSAIAVALQICLGATSRNTGRGSNLSTHIMSGSPGPAICRVTLLNEGDDSYKPDVYGDRIQIERRINRGGSCGYKILGVDTARSRGKNRVFKVVSTEKKELDIILVCFNIFVSNPCCVLTQEESKKFISGAATEKYDFFLKATGLERNKAELNDVTDHLQSAMKNYDVAVLKLSKEQAVATEFHQKLQKLLDLSKNEYSMKENVAKIHWLAVKDEDDVLQQLNEGKRSKTEDLGRVEAEVVTIDNEINGLGSLEKLDAKMAVISTTLKESKEEETAKQRLIHDTSMQLSRLEIKTKLDDKEHAEFKNRLKAVKKEVATLKQKSLDDAEGAEREVLERLQTCDRLIEELSAKENSIIAEKSGCGMEKDGLQAEYEKLRLESNEMQKSISKQEKELKELTASMASGGNSTVFGGKVPQILKELKKQCGSLRGPVHGPFGQYVKITPEAVKDGCQRAVEKILGVNLQNFVVTNLKDLAVVNGIFRKMNCTREHKCICLSLRARYASTRIPNVRTVADCIIVENDMVFNCLMDNGKLDKVAVVVDEKELDREIKRPRANGTGYELTRGIQRAVDFEGRIYSYKNGNAQTLSNRDPFRKLLSEDVGEIINEMMARLRTDNDIRDGLIRRENSKKDPIIKLDADIKNLSRQIVGINNEWRAQKQQKKTLEEKRNELKSNTEIDTGPLEEEQADLEHQLEIGRLKKEEQTESYNDINKVLQQRKADKAATEKAGAKLIKELQEVENAIEDFAMARQRLVQEKESLGRRSDAFRASIVKLEKDIDKQAAAHKTKWDIAFNYTKNLDQEWDEVPLPLSRRDTKVSLERKIKELGIALEQQKKQQGVRGMTMPDIVEKLKRATADVEETERSLEELKAMIADLEVDLKQRKKAWKIQLKKTSREVNTKFDEYLQVKGSSGGVAFDHKEHLIEIQMQPDNVDANTQSSDVRQLSGGERSLTTLCLLLALGHVVETPFRVLDEFDVYMDQMTRSTTLKELERHALAPSNLGRQHIVITPQELNSVITTPMIRIHKLKLPDRLESHGLQQTTLDDY